MGLDLFQLMEYHILEELTNLKNVSCCNRSCNDGMEYEYGYWENRLAEIVDHKTNQY